MCENTMMPEELRRSMSELELSEDNDSPSGERWDPVGANNGDDDFALEYKHEHSMDGYVFHMRLSGLV